MQTKTMRRYFSMAILAEQKTLQELQPFCVIQQDLKEYFKKKFRVFKNFQKFNNLETWDQPLDLLALLRAQILKILYQKLLKRDLIAVENFVLVLIDRYEWSPQIVSWIMDLEISELEEKLRIARLDLVKKRYFHDQQDKGCFLFRPKIVAWDLKILSKMDHSFVDHYKNCEKCQGEFAAYEEAKEVVRGTFPFQVNLSLVEGKKKIRQSRVYFVYSFFFVLIFSGVILSTLPQLKMIWSLKSIKSIRYYEDAQAQVNLAIRSSVEQLTNVESKVIFAELPTSEFVVAGYDKANPNNVPKWLNSQLRTLVTRLFAQTKDIELTKKEIESLVRDLNYKSAGDAASGVEEKPNGILVDIFVPKKSYPDFKSKINQLSSLTNVEENQYKNWDDSKTRVMMWVQKQY